MVGDIVTPATPNFADIHIITHFFDHEKNF